MTAIRGTAATPAVGRHDLLAVGVGGATTAAVLATGLADEVPPLALGWMAAFVFLSVEADVRSRRIPNLLTLPTLVAGIAFGWWSDGISGLVGALAAGAVCLAVLLPAYAIGALGAGDVKALVALGAWLGPGAAAGLVWRALLISAGAGVLWLAWRRELGSFGRRWFAIATATLATRRLHYVAPAPRSAATSAIPFAVAIGLALGWLGAEGLP